MTAGKKLASKAAVVTGGGSGIGRATALLFAREGARVCIADINDQAAGETRDIICSRFGRNRSVSLKTDVSVESDVRNLMKFAAERLGKLDIVFNNAGIYEWTSVERTPSTTWDKIISVNLRGAFLGIKHSFPFLRKTRGVIVNTSSSLGVAGAIESAAYCASKAGVIGLTKASALDLAKYHIRVNCICPGSIETSMQQREFSRSGNARKMRKAYDRIYPMGRIGKPDEVANLVLFLSSEESSSFITGAAFLIDGGLFAQWGESLAAKISG